MAEAKHLPWRRKRQLASRYTICLRVRPLTQLMLSKCWTCCWSYWRKQDKYMEGLMSVLSLFRVSSEGQVNGELVDIMAW